MTWALAALLLAETFPTSFTARQGKSLDGGYTAWAVDCVNCSGGGVASSVTITGAVSVNLLDAGVLPLPTGASTSALQTTGNTSLSSIDGKLPALVSSRVPVDPSGVTSPVSLAAVPTHAVTQSGTWTVQPGNTANTTAWKVDGSAVTQPVSGTVTANAGSNLNTSALALDATLTGGTQKAIARGGAKGATAAADVTSTANGVDHQGLDVQLQNASVAVTGPLTDTQLRASAVPVSGTVTASGPLTDTQLRASAVPVSGTVTTSPPSNASSNVAQVNGVTTQTGAGASGTGTIRVMLASDSALAANQAVNLAQVAGATTATGNGTAAGSIRVSVASDSTGTIAATQSGTWSDRIVGNAGAAIDAANNAAAPANVWVGGWQLQSGATATAGTSGQVGSPVASLDHVPYARLGGPVTWSCSLDNLGATLTQCQGVGGAGLKYYLTDIEIESTTATAGLFLVRTGTGTNCGTGTASLLPSAATVPRLSYPANTAANPSVFHFLTPVVSPAASEICIICTATNTCSVQMTGYTAP